MAGACTGAEPVRGYVVLREVEAELWFLVGDVDHRPGLTARGERAHAVRDATGGADPAGGVYAVLPRDQWRLVGHA